MLVYICCVAVCKICLCRTTILAGCCFIIAGCICIDLLCPSQYHYSSIHSFHIYTSVVLGLPPPPPPHPILPIVSWNCVYVFVDCSSGVHPAWFTVNSRKFADLFQAESVDFVLFLHMLLVVVFLFVLSIFLMFFFFSYCFFCFFFGGGGGGVAGGMG